MPLVGGYFIVQTSLTHWQFPTPNPLVTLAGLLSLVLVNAFGNNVNAIYDVEIDRRNKPYRPIPAGLISIKEVGYVSVAMVLLVAILGSLLNQVFGLLVLLLVVLTYFYSAPPLRVKRFLWVNNIYQAFIRGVLFVLAAWSIYRPITIQALAETLFLFTLIFAAQSSKDFADVEGDRKFGIRTLPVVYGIPKTINIMKLLLFVPFALLIVYRVLGIFPVTLVLLWFLAPGAAYFVRSLEKPSGTMENTLGWVMFYGLMLASLGIFSLIG